MQFSDLNEGQQTAFNAAIDAIRNKKHLTINGPAGTGKTTLTKFLIDHLVSTGEKGVMLTAPTHAAKKVLSKLAGVEAYTIHSVLKISPSNYEDQQDFTQSDTPDLSDCRVLICDEVSMYDRELFRILTNSIPRSCTIIGLGDIAQIRPVAPGATIPELSAFFFNENFTQVALTQVMRSNAPIIKVATAIREGGWIHQELVDGQGVHDLTVPGKSVANFLTKYFEVVKTPEDLLDNRMLAFTNKSVNDLNKIIRKRIYKTDEPFIVNEVLVMQEPYARTHSFEGKSFSETIFNNGEFVRIKACTATTTTLNLKGYSGPSEEIDTWSLDVEAFDNPEVTATLTVIHDENANNILQFYLSKAATEFKSNPAKARGNWKLWWALRNKFTKVKPLPVGTIHKSQGSTVDSCFVYTPCIHKADPALAQQLLYVACTRARNNVYFI